MDKYTDADVERKLGWYDAEGRVIDVVALKLPPFGLSTPPGPEADANAARYAKEVPDATN